MRKHYTGTFGFTVDKLSIGVLTRPLDKSSFFMKSKNVVI